MWGKWSPQVGTEPESEEASGSALAAARVEPPQERTPPVAGAGLLVRLELETVHPNQMQSHLEPGVMVRRRGGLWLRDAVLAWRPSLTGAHAHTTLRRPHPR